MEQMGIAGLADSTQAMYLREIETLNKHYNKPPDRLDARRSAAGCWRGSSAVSTRTRPM